MLPRERLIALGRQGIGMIGIAAGSLQLALLVAEWRLGERTGQEMSGAGIRLAVALAAIAAGLWLARARPARAG